MKSPVSRVMSSTLASAALQFEAALDQPAGAGADHVARGLQRHRRQALAVEHEVERVDQVGRRIHQRAVEIEYNSAGRGHRQIAIGRSEQRKWWLPGHEEGRLHRVAMRDGAVTSLGSIRSEKPSPTPSLRGDLSSRGGYERCSSPQNDARYAPGRPRTGRPIGGGSIGAPDLHVNMDELKRQAAARALDQVRDGMKLGLGTGSTAKHFVELLGERVRDGLDVIGVPTSEATRADADALRHSL